MENPILIYSLLFIFVLALLGPFLKKGTSKKKAKLYQYKKKPYIMTKRENDFYKILEDILPEKFYIFPQIQITSLFDHKINGRNNRAALNHIRGRSVDYVICDKDSLHTLLAVELDDSSHEREDRIERDSEIERIFIEADAPLLRIPASKMFDREFVTQELRNILT